MGRDYCNQLYFSPSAVFKARRLQSCIYAVDLSFDDWPGDAASLEILGYKRHWGVNEFMKKVLSGQTMKVLILLIE